MILNYNKGDKHAQRIDPAYDLVIVYLTNYGQPERSLEGDEGWNRFFRDIDVMGLCNMVLGKLA